MLLSGITAVFFKLTREVSFKATLQKNLSNLTWRIARSIEDDINSAPLEMKYLLSTTYAPALFEHSSFIPIKNSEVIISSRLGLQDNQTIPSPRQRFLAISKDLLCEYAEDGKTEIRSLVFNNDCAPLLGLTPLVHTHLYFVDTNNILRLMSIEGDTVTENQPLYSSIKSISLDVNGIEVTSLSGIKSYAIIIPRTTQLSLEDFGKILPTLLNEKPLVSTK
jgi:hypothetical protein